MGSCLLFRASWRFFIRNPWQIVLTLLSIALGTAVIVGIDLAKQSAEISFARSVNVLAGEMTHEITALQGSVPLSFYRQLRNEWGYRNSSPQIEVALQKDGLQYRLVGVDPFAFPLDADSGLALSPGAIARFLTETNGVIAPAAMRLAAGDVLGMQHESKPVAFNVLALHERQPDLLLTDIAIAQALSGTAGLSRIQLKLTPQRAIALAARLPTGLQLESFRQRQQSFSQMTQAFNTNLQAMSLLAILVGAFLVYNTMTFSVLQRRQTFAIERMLGVTGVQLFRHLMLEAFLLGMVGGMLGVVLGVILGQGLLLLIAQTINDLFISVNSQGLLLSVATIGKGILVTLGAVLIATLAPAAEVARVQPAQVSRRSALERGSQRIGGWLAVLGLVLLGLGWVVLSVSARSLVPGFVGLFLLIMGYSLCLPWVLRGLLKLSLALFRGRRFSLLWRMTLRGVEAGLSRTSLAIIALAVAVSATVGVSIMVGSFRASVVDWLEMTLSSDVYISATSQDQTKVQGRLHEAWLERVRAMPQVQAVSSGRTLRLSLKEGSVSALVLEPAAHSANGFEYLEGDAGTIWGRYLAGEGVLISEPFAYHRNLSAGDELVLLTELSGKVVVPVLGVFRDYSAAQGRISMPRLLYERHWSDLSRSSLGLKLKGGVDAEAVIQQLQAWAAELQLPGQALAIRSNQAIREFSLEIFDRTFAVTHVLRVLAIIVAFVGVFSALMALFLERSREFGVLRALGFTPQQLRGLVLAQTAVMGGLAGLLALPLGWLMSDILIDIINRRSFGWTMQSYFFIWVPAQAFLLAVIAALLAGIYPVWRIGSMQVRESLVS